MSGTIIGTPNSPPTADADWDKVINNYVVGGKGQNSVSLTEWAAGNTTKPAIAAGSTIEVNGSFAQFPTQDVIGDDGALVTGTIYLYMDVTTLAGTVYPKFTNTAPTWSDAKGGWYNGNDRYTGHLMTWDGASAYSGKKGTIGGGSGNITVSASEGDIVMGINTGNIALKTKIYTGTLSTSPNDIAHGLIAKENIYSAYVFTDNTTSMASNPNFIYVAGWTDTFIAINNDASYIGNPYTLVVQYV